MKLLIIAIALFAPFSLSADTREIKSFLEPEMIPIRAGCFQMGSPVGEPGRRSDEDQHTVCLGAFLLGKYEITLAQYDQFAELTKRSKPDDMRWGRDKRPAINVSWLDAAAYAAWLAKQTGKSYRLPTEAEWEYAARAGTSTAFWWGPGNRIGAARCNGCESRIWSARRTAPVGSFAPNAWGLFDTSGNVWEWTCSEYSVNYNGQEKICGNANGDKVLRGGSWFGFPDYMRSAVRDHLSADVHNSLTGFRIALGAIPIAK